MKIWGFASFTATGFPQLSPMFPRQTWSRLSRRRLCPNLSATSNLPYRPLRRRRSPAQSQRPLPVAARPSLFGAADRVAGDTLRKIREDLRECTRGKLHKGRNKIVFGDGNPKAELVFVGEGPDRKSTRLNSSH